VTTPALANSKLPRPVGGDLFGRLRVAAAERRTMDAVERFFVGMAIVSFLGLFLTVGLSMYPN
jgi:hypothetical protein